MDHLTGTTLARPPLSFDGHYFGAALISALLVCGRGPLFQIILRCDVSRWCIISSTAPNRQFAQHRTSMLFDGGAGRKECRRHEVRGA